MNSNVNLGGEKVLKRHMQHKRGWDIALAKSRRSLQQLIKIGG
ncbi:hypothetical protein SAMN05216387_101450 [Nitrosovibrio tenuis]|uniref:Uncharacterized protein n=1 Tax=Nitrosovibrio tenuis TaxID=1233 RepID=A0A1H7H1P9_9PROT|nr:hypothetical protein SAMN05216387_101450 [Nitrosovibrio tenuis]